jgi:GntR family transcriptional regulator, transcriptional repressor for pyruvate dehydrogenase complex
VVKISKVKQKTVVEQVMDQIKNLIASGQLKPHDRIPTETELAQMFGVGRSTVREAIKIFQYLGILEVSPRTGTVVGDYTNVSTEALTWSILLRKNDLYELVALREVIEQRALETLTALCATAPQRAEGIIADLEQQVRRMRDAVAASAIEDIVAADYEFHRLIIAACGNTLFSNIYDTLRSFMLEEIRKTNLIESTRATLVDEHRAIIAGIRSGESQSALRAFETHITGVEEQLKQSLAES